MDTQIKEVSGVRGSGFFSRGMEMCRTVCAAPHTIWSILGIVGIGIVIWAIFGWFGIAPSTDFPWSSGSRWQAVFLTNNQVYFGHVANYNRGYAVLRDVYYLQTQQAVQPGQSLANLNLVKLGNEIHGPEDAIFVPKNQILFLENLKNDSQVVKAIESTRK